MLKSLVSIRLRSMLIGTVGQKKDCKGKGKGRIVGLSILFTILILCFMLFSVCMAAPMAMVLVPMNMEWVFFALFNAITFSFVFIFSIFETKSELFEAKDNELLFSMPIRSGDILVSRILSILLINVGEALIIMLPALVVFAVFGGSVLYVLTGLITSILLVFLATALSSAVGYLVALVAKRFKNHSLVTLFASLAFLILYFVFYGQLMAGLDMLEFDPEGAMTELSESLLIIKGLGDASMCEPLSTLILVLLTVGVCYIAYTVISKSYIGIISDKSGEKKKKYVKKTIEVSSAYSALVKKEFSKIYSSASYMLNGAMGVLMQIVLAVFLLVSAESIMVEAEFIFTSFGMDSHGGMQLIGILVASVFASLTTLTASAISLEGKNFWIIKSAPISAEVLMYAKLTPHVVLVGASSLISSVLLMIAFRADLVYAIFYILAPIATNLVFALFGLILNIAFPKFDYENEAQVVKQSLATFIITMVGMLFVFAMMFAAVACAIFLGPFMTVVLYTLLMLVLFVICFLILTGPSKRSLQKLLRA